MSELILYNMIFFCDTKVSESVLARHHLHAGINANNEKYISSNAKVLPQNEFMIEVADRFCTIYDEVSSVSDVRYSVIEFMIEYLHDSNIITGFHIDDEFLKKIGKRRASIDISVAAVAKFSAGQQR